MSIYSEVNLMPENEINLVEEFVESSKGNAVKKFLNAITEKFNKLIEERKPNIPSRSFKEILTSNEFQALKERYLKNYTGNANAEVQFVRQLFPMGDVRGTIFQQILNGLTEKDKAVSEYFKSLISVEDLSKMTQEQGVALNSVLRKMQVTLKELSAEELAFFPKWEDIANALAEELPENIEELKNDGEKIRLKMVEKIQNNDSFRSLINYKMLIESAVNSLAELDTVREFGKEGLKEYSSQIQNGIYDVESGLYSKVSQQDLDIVSAFRYIGVDLELRKENETDPTSRSIWVYPENAKPNEYAFKSKTNEQDEADMVLFTRAQIQGFLDGYLNAPEETKQSRKITPDGVLRAFSNYLEQGVKNISTSKDLSEIDLAQRLAQLKQKDIKSKYSEKSLDFKIAKLLDPNQIMKCAQLQALQNLFSERCAIVDGANISRNFEGRVYDIFNSGEVTQVEEDEFDSISHAFVDYRFGYIKNNSLQTGGDNNFYTNIYDSMIDLIESRESSPENTKLISKLSQAKALLQANIDFQTSWINSTLDISSATAEDLFYMSQDTLDMCYSFGGFIMDENGEIKIKNDGGIDMSEIMNIIKERAERRQGSTEKNIEGVELEEDLPMSAQKKEFLNRKPILGPEINASSSSTSTETTTLKNMPNIFGYFSDIISEGPNGDKYIDLLNNVMLFETAKLLFQKGNAFDQVIEMMVKDNKGKTFNEIFDAFAGKYRFFDADILRDAYIENNPNSEFAKENKEGFTQSTQERNKSFDKQLVLLDMAASSFTPEEAAKYYDDSTPESVKEALIKEKVKAAVSDFNTLKPEEIEKKSKEAEARHKNSILKKLVSEGVGSQIVEFESRLGDGKFKMSAMLEKYLDTLDKEQAVHNQLLNRNGRPILGPELKVKEEKTEENPEEKKETKKKTTYNDIFPFPPSKEKFMKQMKPFSGKEIVKFFIEPLLDDIKKIEVDMDKYNASKIDHDASMMAAAQTDAIENANANDQAHSGSQKTQSETQANTKTENLKVTIKQSDFEAKVFIPASHVLRNIVKSGASPEMQSLSALMDYVAQQESNPMKDCMRHIIFDMVTGKYSNSSAIVKEFENLTSKYPDILSAVGISKFKNAFEHMSPSLAFELLSYSSEYDATAGKLKIGKKLPITELLKVEEGSSMQDVWGEFYATNLGGKSTLRQDQPEFIIRREVDLIKAKKQKAFNQTKLNEVTIQNVEEMLKEEDSMEHN